MSIQNETEKGLFKNLKAVVSGRWIRIENPVGPGTPDAFYCGLFNDMLTGLVHPVSAFVELKIVHTKPHTIKPLAIRFEQGQIPWMVEHAMHGGISIIVIRLLSPCNAYHEIMLVRGSINLHKVIKLPYCDLIRHPDTILCRLPHLNYGLPKFIFDTWNMEAKPRPIREEYKRVGYKEKT